MGWILRTKDDVNNPTLPGGVYGKYITIGRAVYWRYDGSRTRYLIFISDGGRYGMDSIDSLEYNGAVQDPDDYRFHPGTITKQIDPVNVIIDDSNETVIWTAHGLSVDDVIRFGVIDGNMATPLLKTVTYKVRTVDDADTIKIKDMAGTGIDFDDAGTGQMIAWRANAGFDDPDQGLPEFVPEVDTTLSGISYVEGMLTSGVSSPTEPPNWDAFRIIGIGRKLMDYDNTGAEVGLISGADEDLFNLPLQVVDNFLVNYNGRSSRIDWASWKLFRDAADVLIWQRVVDTNDDTPPTTENGFTGRYYDDEVFGNLVLTRQDPTINFPSNSDPPGPGVPAVGFSVEWSGQIQAKFSELTNLKLIHDDHAWLWVDGNLLIDETIYGTHSADYTFVADQLYDIRIRLSQLPATGVNPWACVFKWSSISLPEEVVPASSAVPSDITVARYANHAAFPIAIEASEVHERLMERAPGWDWTDDNGKVTFLGPDRPVVFAFTFDRMDDDTKPNLVKETFEKKRRPLADRPNFLLARWRDVLRTGFPFGFVQADREELRVFTNGEPTNNPAEDLGVSTRSLAERILEMEMTLKSDPTYIALLSGGRRSSLIRKNNIVTCTYIDIDNNFVVDDRMLVTFHAWGASDGHNDFSLLPIEKDFYVDEIFVPE